jgi:hypothetical protein
MPDATPELCTLLAQLLDTVRLYVVFVVENFKSCLSDPEVIVADEARRRRR